MDRRRGACGSASSLLLASDVPLSRSRSNLQLTPSIPIRGKRRRGVSPSRGQTSSVADAEEGPGANRFYCEVRGFPLLFPLLSSSGVVALAVFINGGTRTTGVIWYRNRIAFVFRTGGAYGCAGLSLCSSRRARVGCIRDTRS
jgi:hypothetical protein